jgi:TM2 domain-containing membrane protein YozV
MNPYIAGTTLNLSPQGLAWFEMESSRYRREPALAFALALVLGMFGAHDFYLGDRCRGTWMLIGTLSGIGTIITIPLWFVSLFTVWRDCENYNDAVDYWLLSWASAGTPTPPEPPPQPKARTPIGGLPVPVAR